MNDFYTVNSMCVLTMMNIKEVRGTNLVPFVPSDSSYDFATLTNIQSILIN
jgi:hypothetical protein